MPVHQNGAVIATQSSTLMLTLFLLLKHKKSRQLRTDSFNSCSKGLDLCLQCNATCIKVKQFCVHTAWTSAKWKLKNTKFE